MAFSTQDLASPQSNLIDQQIAEALSFPTFFENQFCKTYGYTFEPFQRKIAESFQKHKRTLTMVARGHGKTEMVAAYAIWHAKYNPGSQILIVSSALDQSTRILARIKDRLADIASLQYLLPAITPNDGVDKYRQKDWSKTSITLSNGSRIICSPFSPSIRGTRNDVIIADDIIRDDGKLSKEQAIELFNSVVVPSVNDPKTSQIHVVGTPIYPDDLLAYLKKTGSYHVNFFPALDENNEPIFKSRFTKKFLEQTRKDVGEIIFSREYLLKPIPTGRSIFPPALTEKKITTAVPKEFDYIVMGVDVAMSDSPTADASAFAVVGFKDDIAYLIHLDVFNAMTADEHISHITHLYNAYDIDEIIVEKNGISFSMVEKLETETTLPITPFTTTRKKKEIALGRIKTFLEQDRLYFAISHNLDILMEEMHSIVPKQNGRLEALTGHDDTVMALALALTTDDAEGGPSPKVVGIVETYGNSSSFIEVV